MAGRESPFSSRPNATLPSTVIHGNNAYSWKTIARSGPGPDTGWPLASTVPLVGGANPAITFRSVDFPHPDGPRRHTSSPGSTSRSIPSSAITSRAPDRNTLWTSRTRTAGSVTSALHSAVPPQRPGVEPVHADVDAETAQPDRDHPGDDLVRPHELPGLEDAIAESLVHRGHLRDDHHDERDADPDPHTGQDVRHRRGQDDPPEERGLVRAEVLGGADVDRVDV